MPKPPHASECLASQEVRRNWSERAFNNETLDLAAEADKVCQERLFCAKTSYDQKEKELKGGKQQQNGQPRGQPQQQQKKQSAELCHICGKPGHTAAKCWHNPAKGKGKGKKPAQGGGNGSSLLAGVLPGGKCAFVPGFKRHGNAVESNQPSKKAKPDAATVQASISKLNETLAALGA